jgi:hypothetical protein
MAFDQSFSICFNEWARKVVLFARPEAGRKGNEWDQIPNWGDFYEFQHRRRQRARKIKTFVRKHIASNYPEKRKIKRRNAGVGASAHQNRIVTSCF